MTKAEEHIFGLINEVRILLDVIEEELMELMVSGEGDS